MRQQLLIPLVLFFMALFNAPILSSLAQWVEQWQAIPVVFVYLFLAWALLIGLLYWITTTKAG